MEERDVVWAQTTDGGLLHQLFGYYPTMHDAEVRSITLHGQPLAVTIVVDYADQIEGPDRNPSDDLATRIRLEWTGVTSFDFPLGDADLLGLDLARHGEQIVTTLETWPGIFGTIVSETFEAVLMQMDPGPNDDRAWISFKPTPPGS
ncbi:MAG: hypothetical protein ACO1SV_00480 [Fimbriimonas sp.]